MSVTPLPDAVALVSAVLLARPAVAGLVGTRVGTRSPSDTSSPWIRVTRLGGLPDSLAPWSVDHAQVQVECWAPPGEDGDTAAMTLARIAQAELLAASLVADDGAVLVGVDPWTGLQSVPDTSRPVPTPRVLFGVVVTTTPSPSAG